MKTKNLIKSMKKCIKRRMLAAALTLVLAGTAIPSVTPHTVNAADDFAAQAQTIQVNSPITGSITKDSSIHYYRFVCTADGYFTISLSHTNISETGQWTLKLLNENRNYTYYTYKRASLEAVKLPCVKGQVYYINVSDYSCALNQQYKLTINQSAAANWEREDNDSQGSATPLTANVPMTGIIIDNDVDWYTLKTPSKPGYFIFNLTHADISETGEWRMEILDENGTVYDNFTGQSLSSCKWGFDPDSTIYVKISDYSCAGFEHYNLNAAFTEDPYFESEPNSSTANADSISYGQDYTGVLDYYINDVDYYKFTVPSLSKVSLHFGPQDLSDNGTWGIKLLNEAGQETDIMYTSTIQDNTMILKKGTYYLKVTNYSVTWFDYYTFRLTRSDYSIGGKTKISKVKRAGKTTIDSIRLSKRVKSAPYYQVKLSHKKRMSDAKLYELDNKKTLVLDYSGYSKTRYYIQAQPYAVDPFGYKIYGKKSNKASIKTKSYY